MTTKSKLDALMHEWHEWSNVGGRELNERYDGCYEVASFVLRHMNEWAVVVPWCAEHDGEWKREPGKEVGFGRCVIKAWSDHCGDAVRGDCRLEEPARVFRIEEQ